MILVEAKVVVQNCVLMVGALGGGGRVYLQYSTPIS